jgi:hypothetical protein
MPADVLRYLSISAGSLWGFLHGIAAGMTKERALRSVVPTTVFSARTMQRHWMRLRRQSWLRTNLTTICEPPRSCSAVAAVQTIQHLQAAFPDTPCPLAAYQLHFQRDVLRE